MKRFPCFLEEVLLNKQTNQDAIICIAIALYMAVGVRSESGQSLCSGVPKPLQFFVDGFKPTVVWF